MSEKKYYHIKRTNISIGESRFLSCRQRSWLFIERLDAKFGKWEKDEAEAIMLKRKEMSVEPYQFEIVAVEIATP